ncbi:MAG: flavodoxin family protein [Anaerolineae bacterium]|jgi:multimeric flavodoxin WrbA
MKVLVISSSPNDDGLTAACARAAIEGTAAAGHQAEAVRLNDLDIGLCRACGNGWGPCREEHRCCQEDDLDDLLTRMTAADALVLVTPVYFGEPSESMKAMLDRVRRCTFLVPEGPDSLASTPVLAVAAAGGSGNGAVTCLETMERWIQHVGAKKTDFIAVTRFTRSYKMEQIAEAVRSMLTSPV